jgi:hypothetical protein
MLVLMVKKIGVIYSTTSIDLDPIPDRFTAFILIERFLRLKNCQPEQ